MCGADLAWCSLVGEYSQSPHQLGAGKWQWGHAVEVPFLIRGLGQMRTGTHPLPVLLSPRPRQQ